MPSLRKTLSLISLSLATTILLGGLESATPSYASRPPSCSSVVQKADLELGTVCIKKLEIDTGKADWPNDREPANVEYTPPNSQWLIVDISSPIETSVNNGRVTNQKHVAGGENSLIKTNLDNQYGEIVRIRNEIDTKLKVPIKGVPTEIGGHLKNLRNLEEQNRQIHKHYSRALSNVTKVIVQANANGVCKTRILGECVDGEGGWYRGYVEVTQVYVGDVDAHLNNIKEEVVSLQREVEIWADDEQEKQSLDKPKNTNTDVLKSEDSRTNDQKDLSKSAQGKPGSEQEPGFWVSILNFFKRIFS